MNERRKRKERRKKKEGRKKEEWKKAGMKRQDAPRAWNWNEFEDPMAVSELNAADSDVHVTPRGGNGER